MLALAARRIESTSSDSVRRGCETAAYDLRESVFMDLLCITKLMRSIRKCKRGWSERGMPEWKDRLPMNPKSLGDYQGFAEMEFRRPPGSKVGSLAKAPTYY